jgi:hypothetical protein
MASQAEREAAAEEAKMIAESEAAAKAEEAKASQAAVHLQRLKHSIPEGVTP